MSEQRFPIGVCVFRAERVDDRVVITVRTNHDIDTWCGERVESVSDVETATRALREFLHRRMDQ